MVLVNSPGFENMLIGTHDPSQLHQMGLFYRILDVDVNEVVKNAAVQLNVWIGMQFILAKYSLFLPFLIS